MPRIIEAEEGSDGYVTATVAFPDGLNQTVRLPKNLATKANLKSEAQRLRSEAEAEAESKTKRADLVE